MFNIQKLVFNILLVLMSTFSLDYYLFMYDFQVIIDTVIIMYLNQITVLYEFELQSTRICVWNQINNDGKQIVRTIVTYLFHSIFKLNC